MEQRKFLAMVGPLAQADMQKSGILASLTIAQAILESGWGTSELAAKAARVLEGSFDIEIVEAHHNQKIDAPSGTALMLADSISDALSVKPKYEFDRHSKRAKRSKNEIGIHSIRGGTIVGEHEIIFAGHDEIITISHSARSKELFATGAINAALFLEGKPAGLYNMRQLVDAK